MPARVVWRSPRGQRLGWGGCAEAFLDGDPGAAAEADLRYVGASGLPTMLTQQSVTLRRVGRVQFGNLAKGDHTLRISVDGGSTFIAEVPFNLPLVRSEATSLYKAVRRSST